MSALRNLKLIDPDGKVALTNVGVWLVFVLVTYATLRSGTIDPTALGALLTALGAYRTKSWQQDQREARAGSQAAEIERLKALVKAPPMRTDNRAQLPPGLR